MRKTSALTLVVGFALIFSACSSSQLEDGAAGDDEFPVADAAGTDAVPTDGFGELTPPPAEGETAMSPEGTIDPGAAAPAPEMAPAETASAADVGGGATGDYTVQEGDTLMKIAFETYGDLYQWRKIYESNKERISDPNAVPKGTVLKLEQPSTPVAIERNGEKYLIKPGDTLGKISNNVYGTQTQWRKLWENNRQLIKDPNKIFAGFHLYYVPGAGGGAPSEPSGDPAPLAGGDGSVPTASVGAAGAGGISAAPVDPGAAAAAPADGNRDPASPPTQ